MRIKVFFTIPGINGIIGHNMIVNSIDNTLIKEQLTHELVQDHNAINTFNIELTIGSIVMVHYYKNINGITS